MKLVALFASFLILANAEAALVMQGGHVVEFGFEDQADSLMHRNSIDLRYLPGTGYYVSPERRFEGRTRDGKSYLVSGALVEIIDHSLALQERSCSGRSKPKPCSDTELLVRVWPTKLNSISSKTCVCVPAVKLADDFAGEYLPPPAAVPGFPTPVLGDQINVYPVDPGTVALTPEGETLGAENLKGVAIEDLGPAGRDEYGRPFRYARFYKTSQDGQGLVSLGEDQDRIYLVLDDAPTQTAHLAIDHVAMKNFMRVEGNMRTKVELDQAGRLQGEPFVLDHTVFFEPLRDNPNQGLLFQMQNGEYQPLSKHLYSLQRPQDYSRFDFADYRNSRDTPFRLKRTVFGDQALAILGHSETYGMEPEVADEVPVAEVEQPVAPVFALKGFDLYRPEGDKAKNYDNLYAEIVRREAIPSSDGGMDFLVRLWKKNEFDTFEPFNQRAIYGVSLDPQSTVAYLPAASIDLSEFPQVFHKKQERSSIAEGVHVPESTPLKDHHRRLIDNAMSRKGTYNYCAYGVKLALTKTYDDFPMKRCDAFEVDITYDLKKYGFQKLNTLNPNEAPPGAVIIYDSFAKKGTYRSRPRGRSADDMRVDFPSGINRKYYVPYYGHIEIKTDSKKYPFVSDHKQTSSVINHPTQSNLDKGWGFSSSKKREYQVVGIWYRP